MDQRFRRQAASPVTQDGVSSPELSLRESAIPNRWGSFFTTAQGLRIAQLGALYSQQIQMADCDVGAAGVDKGFAPMSPVL